MKILLVSPFPNDKDLYPHLAAVISELSKEIPLEYCFFPERGYELHLFVRLLCNPFRIQFLRGIRHLLRMGQGCLRLLTAAKDCDTVIAVDNFLYMLCCIFLRKKRIILWSHDFISDDQKRKSSTFQSFIARKTAEFLVKYQEIIIQDEDRLRVLLESIEGKSIGDVIECFYLPVSLPDVEVKRDKLCILPLLMQIGGIRTFTMSHKLLEHYQRKTSQFELYFHGFISEEILAQVNGCARVPILSGERLAADRLPRLIARADIGFIYYDGADDLNYYNIRNASCQLVEFLRLGKPIIAMGNTNLQDLFDEHAIGQWIEDFSELDAAIDTITTRYNVYAENARNLFSRDYDLNLYIPESIVWLSR